MARSVEERAQWFSWRSQGLGHAGTDALEALRAVIGVYSSQPSGPLSLLARLRSLEPAEFDALVAEKRALRMPGPRRSIHLLPRDTAHQVFAATVGSMPTSDPGLRYYKVSDADYKRLRKKALRAAREPLSKSALRKELGADGTTASAVVAAMCREGVMLRTSSSSLRSNTLEYVATDAWLDGGLPAADPREARGWLAGEYLRAFGPARAEDFTWWSGLDPKLAREGLDGVETVEAGDGFLLLPEDERAFSGARAKKGTVDLLPRWDAYIMGYPAGGRGRFADDDVVGRIYEGSGDGLPVVLVDGRAYGAWWSRFNGKRMEVSLELFDRPGKTLDAAIRRELEGVAALLGAGQLEVSEGEVTRRT